MKLIDTGSGANFNEEEPRGPSHTRAFLLRDTSKDLLKPQCPLKAFTY